MGISACIVSVRSGTAICPAVRALPTWQLHLQHYVVGGHEVVLSSPFGLSGALVGVTGCRAEGPGGCAGRRASFSSLFLVRAFHFLSLFLFFSFIFFILLSFCRDAGVSPMRCMVSAFHFLSVILRLSHFTFCFQRLDRETLQFPDSSLFFHFCSLYSLSFFVLFFIYTQLFFNPRCCRGLGTRPSSHS